MTYSIETVSDAYNFMYVPVPAIMDFDILLYMLTICSR